MDVAAQPEDTLRAARAALSDGAFDRAIRYADTVLAGAREGSGPSTEALYVRAVAQRYSGDLDQSIETLNRLIAWAPAYGRAYQERGHVLRARGDSAGSAEAFRAAVQRNTALVASWSALAALTPATDPFSETIRYHRDRLDALPRELVSVESMMAEGKLFRAEQICRAYLKAHPKDTAGMRLLAQLGVRLNVLDDAEFLLDSAIAFDPQDPLLRLDYIDVLQRRQKYGRALAEAETLLARDPANPAFRAAHANAALAIGRTDEAIRHYMALSHEFADMPGNYLALGHALKTVGRQQDAIKAYRQAYRVKPDFGDAFWSLANLKTYRFEDAELASMARAEAAATTSMEDRIHLCFALGKALEDRQEFAESFTFYERGNRLKRAQVGYDADRMDAELEAQKAQFTSEFLASRSGTGIPDPAPIFIVGLPRAGSTLIEQILASHSQIDGTFELPTLLAIVHRLNGRRRIDEAPRYPGNLAELPAEKLADLGRKYIEDTRIYRGSAPFFTDKMPNNFRHIGLIHMLLPNARVIDARRAPMACCFSGFKQLFAQGQEFTYGLEQIGRYYRGYVDLMAHWDRVLPGKVLRIQHEDVIADLEGQVRRMLDFLELAFEPACLAFHRSDRAVRTASSEQVRQPINRRGVDQWRPYTAYLGPLRQALGPALRDPECRAA